MQKEELKNTEKDYNHAVLLLLQSSVIFRVKFLLFAPEIEADIQSAAINKDCSCKNKVFRFVDENKDRFNDFLYDFLIVNDLFITFIEYLDSTPIYKNYSGKVAKTSISEWMNFTNNLANDNAQFKAFSVVKDGDDLLVFFL